MKFNICFVIKEERTCICHAKQRPTKASVDRPFLNEKTVDQGLHVNSPGMRQVTVKEESAIISAAEVLFGPVL